MDKSALSPEDYQLEQVAFQLIEAQKEILLEGPLQSFIESQDREQIATAAACYAMTPERRSQYQSYHVNGKRWFPRWWPWAAEIWDPEQDRLNDLAKASALLMIEMKRVIKQRAQSDKTSF